MSRDRAWWRDAVIYQIYPRSFMDSNGDGVGDLPGITSKLDYLSWLGVDALWLSPIYPSPMYDFGYDVSDYTGVHPDFGTLDDFDELATEAQKRDLRVILDFVPNHSSHLHPWFIESRSSRDNPKRDWYIWRDAKDDGSPPNNWQSRFGGSVWKWDETTAQYYMHAFLKEQPDLNWKNPEVRKAMADVLRFWLDRGVSGFRIDTFESMAKDPAFSDWQLTDEERREMAQRPITRLYARDDQLGELHGWLKELRDVAKGYGEPVLIGEVQPYSPTSRAVTYYGEGDELDLPFNFGLITRPWEPAAVRNLLLEYESLLPLHGWPNYVLGNHDRPRITTRAGRKGARTAAMLLFTARGAAFVYQGEELGMTDAHIPPDRIQDPKGKRLPGLTRDPSRSPVQWTPGPHGGFSRVEPWLPLADDHEVTNVERERDDPRSMLSLYRELIRLKKTLPALREGAMRIFSEHEANSECVVYSREGEGGRCLVALNLSDQGQQVQTGLSGPGEVLLSTFLDRERQVAPRALDLRPREGLLVRLPPRADRSD